MAGGASAHRPPWGPPQFPILRPHHPTHVIAVFVAATHRAVPSGAVIGHVGMVSRLRGNDVRGDGHTREWRAPRSPCHTAIPPKVPRRTWSGAH